MLHKKSWVLKNWCFWTLVFETTLESPLDWKEIQPVHPKGSQSWVLVGRTDAQSETPILWSLDVKNWLIGRDPDAGKDWRQEEKGMTEDEMAGWHHQLDGYGFEQAPRFGDGQGSLVCCSPWVCKELDMTERLNWTELMLYVVRIFILAFLVAQMVKNLPTVQETWVQSLGREDPLEKGLATHSSILAWRIPWTEEPGRLQSMGLHRVRLDGVTNTCTVWQNHLTQSLFYIKVLNVTCNLLNTVLDWKPEWLCG